MSLSELKLGMLVNELRIANQLKLIELMDDCSMLKAEEQQKILKQMADVIFNGHFNDLMRGEEDDSYD